MVKTKYRLMFIMERSDNFERDIECRYKSAKCIENKLNCYAGKEYNTEDPPIFKTIMDDENPITYKTTTTIFIKKEDHDNLIKILNDIVDEVTTINQGRRPTCYYDKVVSYEV